jgi:hypothetical protein
MERTTTLAAVAGAAAGACLSRGRTTSGPGLALATAVGAAMGATCVAVIVRRWQTEAWWHDEANVRTFDDVAREDAEFRAAAAAAPTDATAEAQALHRLFDGESSATLERACAALNMPAKLVSAKARWEPWRQVPPAKLGAIVTATVEELEADHLRPSGIETRLNGGVHAACHGLFALMNNCKFDSVNAA